ncbi:hypothetical protein FOCC_FOCC015390 [Frankliniella occidentalis]|nr:hypothetical protein FOCC_FOCC015390 [Frankliniella occidentalis]
MAPRRPKVKLRRLGRAPVLDLPLTDFSGTQLPSHGDVLVCYVWVREVMKRDAGTNKDPARSEVMKTVVEKVTAIWKKANLPVVTPFRIERMLSENVDEMKYLNKYPPKKRGKAYQARKQVFLAKSKLLFDICTCKCDGYCTCLTSKEKPGKSTKLVSGERPFLVDQRTTRKLKIGELQNVTPSTSRKRQRDERPVQRMLTFSSEEESPSKPKRQKTDDDFESPPKRRTRTSDRNMMPLTNTAATAARYNVPIRVAAAISNSFAVDAGLVTGEDRTKLVAPSKMHRQKDLVLRNENKEAAACGGSPVAIYFDGRKDKTLVIKEMEGTRRTRRVSETSNHVVIIEEPGSKFLGHVTADGSKAAHEADAILEGLRVRNISTDRLRAVGCDGTSYNTGHEDGVLACLEKKLNRPLQRNVCLLHFNELPCRRLLTKLDGQTSGPTGWTGPIGSKLKDCEKLPLVKFNPIPTTLPEVKYEDLSWEQKYFHDMCRAVTTGQCPPELAAKQPGALHHARWLTTGSRILRLYIATRRPSAGLKSFANFVITVYAVMWFGIKKENLAVAGPRHLFTIVKLSRSLPPRMMKIVHESTPLMVFMHTQKTFF